MTVIQIFDPPFCGNVCDDSAFTCNHLILHLAARQKEKAMGSITEVVQTVKDPKSTIRSMNEDTAATKHEELEQLNYDFALPKSVESEIASTPPPGRKSSMNFKDDNNLSRFSSYEERNNKSSRKSGMTSFKGYFVYHLLLFKFDQ